MKRLLVGAIAALVTLSVASVASANPWYARVDVGQLADAQANGAEIDDGLVYGAGIGTAVGPLRVEVAASRVDGKFVNAIDVDAIEARATAYLDLRVSENTAWYIGAGPSWISAEANFGAPLADTDGWGYHVTGGISHRIRDGLILDAGVRYTASDDLGGADLEAFTPSVGVRFAL